MTKDKLKKEIITIFGNSKLKWKPHTVTDNVSRFKIKNCSGCTQNAAAYILGLIKEVKVWQKLSKEDRESLKPYNVSDIVDKFNNHARKAGSKSRKIRTKEVSITFCEEFVNEANENAKIYPYIYILENSLRKIILNAFKDKKDWWGSKSIHSDIKDYSRKIEKAEQKYKWMDKRGEHPIYYINLEHLFKIIEMNWNKFKGIFGNQAHLKTWIEESIPIRNLVAHNIKTKQLERQDIISRCTKICKLIDNSQKN